MAWTEKEILDYIAEYEASDLYKELIVYHQYYNVKNPELFQRWGMRERKGKTPNWKIPTPYFATVADTMSGYMFSDVQYKSESEEYELAINEILDANKASTKDMKTGTLALVYNRAYEIVYTVGDEKSTSIKYSVLDPLSVIPIYSKDVEPELIGIFWKRIQNKDEYLLDYIDKAVWESYKMAKDKLELVSTKDLFFTRCPVAEYRSELIGESSPFSVVISYIAALDWSITGNSNEIDRIVDALLLLGKKVGQEDLATMDEWKVLSDISKDEITPQYLTKNLSPEFRKYVTDLLINEIHKHSHVIDWYQSMQGGDASAKALKTRLFDMSMFSNRIEKVYVDGVQTRLQLLGELLQIVKKITPEKVNVRFQRTVPSDVEDLIVILNGVDFISTQTKVEMVGLDWEVEKERLDGEKPEISLDDIMQEPNQEEIDDTSGDADSED